MSLGMDSLVKILAKVSLRTIVLVFLMGGPFVAGTVSADGLVVAPNIYVVGISRAYVNRWARPKVRGRQLESNWCWAASVQMVLNMARIPVTQEQIVKRIFGRSENLPGTPVQIMKALDGWTSMYEGKNVLVSAFIEPSYDQILLDLYLNYPVILALKFGGKIGHAVVITAAKYKVVNGKKQILYFLVRDPWPKNPSAEKLEPQLFKDITGAIGIRISLKNAH
jgi:hypothetical protein